MTYAGIDLLKFFYSINVVAIHTHPFIGINNEFFQNCYSSFNLSAVPFFFIVSGFFLGLKFKNIEKDKKDSLIKVFLTKNIILYIKWTILYLPLTIYGFYLQKISFAHAVVIFFRNFIFVGENFNSWPLWYLLSVTYCSLFLLFTYRLDSKHVLGIGLIIYILGELLTLYIDKYHGEGIIYLLLLKTVGTGRLFKSFLFIPIGIYVASNTKKLEKKYLIFFCIISGFLLVISNYTIKQFVVVIFTLSIFLLIKDIKSSNTAFFILRKLSSNLYFLHMIFFSITSLIIYNEMQYGFMEFILTITITIVFSVIVFKINKKGKKNVRNP